MASLDETEKYFKKRPNKWINVKRFAAYFDISLTVARHDLRRYFKWCQRFKIKNLIREQRKQGEQFYMWEKKK